MSNTNYFSGIVKILETPQQSLRNDQTTMTTFRVEVPQNRNTKIIWLVFWGNLGNEVQNFYRINDYILIEGYSSLRTIQQGTRLPQNSKQVTITVLKVYPFLLTSNHNLTKS